MRVGAKGAKGVVIILLPCYTVECISKKYKYKYYL